MRSRVLVALLLAFAVLLVAFWRVKEIEGFKDIDAALLYKNNQTNNLPLNALCINSNQCANGKKCKSSITNLTLTGQSTSLANVSLAKYGNCT